MGYTDVANSGEVQTAVMDIAAAKRKHEEQLMRLPNVVGVGIGRRAGNRVIKVFVTRKVPESSLQSQDVIPLTLEGWEVDVEEIGVVTADGTE